MMRRRIFAAAVGALTLSVAACDFRTATAVSATGLTAPPTNVDIGEPLYTPAAPKERPKPPANAVAADPIVVRNCQVTLPETQNVPTKNDGKILAFCTEPAEGENVPESEKYVHQRTGKVYRKLHESDIVKRDQLIAILDDAVPAAKLDVAVAAKNAAIAKNTAAVKLEVVARAEFDTQIELKKKNATTDSDYRRAQAQWDQSVAGIAEAVGNLEKAKQEENMARVELNEFEIRSSISGMIRRFYRKAGEGVKALEPVLELQNLEHLRVEGLLDYQYLPAVTGLRSLQAVIEAAPQYPFQQNLQGHLQPVRAVAVSKDSSNPLIVSAGDDMTVRVWDRHQLQIANWVHGVPVRAVACTSRDADRNLCLTGADDGVPRLYDLTARAPAFTDGDKPHAEFKSRHSSQIVSVAFAPNGKYCATADNKEIYMWDTSTGELKYKFPSHHKGPITYIAFTPQCKLLSEARDHSMALWNLGQSGASVDAAIPNRTSTGEVGVLGVNSDGTRVLFDQEGALHILTTGQVTEGVITAPSAASQFTRFALFSPDDRLVLAAGTGDHPLQLWKSPQPGVRGSLIRRLALPPGGQATCAAFAPDGSFAVTGTQDCRVLVWSMPTKEETERVINARITLRDPNIDTDGKFRLWATLPRPQGITLPAGDTVTLVIPQGEGK